MKMDMRTEMSQRSQKLSIQTQRMKSRIQRTHTFSIDAAATLSGRVSNREAEARRVDDVDVGLGPAMRNLSGECRITLVPLVVSTAYPYGGSAMNRRMRAVVATLLLPCAACSADAVNGPAAGPRSSRSMTRAWRRLAPRRS